MYTGPIVGEIINEWVGNTIDATAVTSDTVLTKDAEGEKTALEEKGAIRSISETISRVACERVKVVLLWIIGIRTVDIGVMVLLSERSRKEVLMISLDVILRALAEIDREGVEIIKSGRDISRGSRILVGVLCSGICEVRLSFNKGINVVV